MKITIDDIRERRNLCVFGSLHIDYNDENETVIFEEREETKEEKEKYMDKIYDIQKLSDEICLLSKNDAPLDDELKAKIAQYLNKIDYHYISFIKNDMSRFTSQVIEYIEEIHAKELHDETARLIFVPLFTYFSAIEESVDLQGLFYRIRDAYDFENTEVEPLIHQYLSRMNIGYIPYVLEDLQALEDTNFVTLVSNFLDDIKDEKVRDLFVGQVALYGTNKKKIVNIKNESE